MHPLVDSFGYENVKVPGYEADDVIATLAERAAADGIDVTVVTGDRDLFQLIQPHVRVMATGRGITDTKIYDREAVIDRYGIPPELIPDFYGLKGDTSDNIPGVPGIGDKTATQLLQEWGDLEGVLANIESISGAKRKENLTEHADNARISKRLATAVRDGLRAAERTTASTCFVAVTVPVAVRGGLRFASTRPASASRPGIWAWRPTFTDTRSSPWR